MNTPRSLVYFVAASALMMAGCKPDSAVRTGATIDSKPSSSAAATPAPPANAGEVKGTVKFSGKAPARVPIDMAMDPGCTLAGQNQTEQFVVADGKLANVYIYVKSGAPDSKAANAAPAVVLDQKGCKYVPHVIAVQQGAKVEFHNSDPTMHNVHTMPAVSGNSAVDVSQGPMGAAESRAFNSPEIMLPVRCNNHPWMNAFINVAPNQFFAVTSADGTFTLRGLPPGNYTIAAVHEKLGEQDMPVTVPANGTAKADFAFAAK